MLRAAYENKKRMNPHIAEGTRIERLFDAARLRVRAWEQANLK